MREIKSHVRFSEADRFGQMTVDSIINYLQDCAMVHSESVGRGISSMDEADGYWFLYSWQVDIHRAPVLFENITVRTNPYDFKGFFGYRNFEIIGEDDEVLVQANSIWVYLDSETNQPARIPQDEKDAYYTGIPALDMEYCDRKIEIPEDVVEYSPVPVMNSQLDINQHVNNCEYIRTFIAVTGIEAIPSRVRAEYKVSATEGDVFHPYVYFDSEKCIADLRAEDGTAYAAIEFTF